MKVREVMSSPPVVIGRSSSLRTAVETMIERGVSGLPVVDAHERLVGIVTEGDVIGREVHRGQRRGALHVVADALSGREPRWTFPGSATVGDVMTSSPVTASPREEVHIAARRMIERRVKRLPVVDDYGAVVGVVSRRDVLELFNRTDEEIRADLIERYGSPRWSPEDADLEVEVDDGVVTINGSVLHPMDRAVVDAVAWSVPGVLAVDDRTTPREPDPRPSWQ